VTAHGPEEYRRLVAAAAKCTACELYRDATQVVFGRGPVPARVMLIGEQPGDHEDREGEPFVGPAGRVLAQAADAAGLDLDAAYVTNAVKHFRFERAGKVRIHKKPAAAHVRACRQWWEAELDVVAPDVVVCLGATAAQAVLGAAFRVTRDRGIVVPFDGRALDVVATIHPSAVLRARRPDRDAAFDGLVADLRAVTERLAQVG
jgi:uracil-DNA glycosylase